MAKIPEYYSIGNRNNLSIEQLLRILEDMYTQIAIALNSKPDFVEREGDGLTTDTFLSNGTINLNSSTLKIEMLTAHTVTAGNQTVQWKEI